MCLSPRVLFLSLFLLDFSQLYLYRYRFQVISIFFFFFFDREPLFDSFRNRGMDKRKKGKKALEKSGDYVSCTKKREKERKKKAVR